MTVGRLESEGYLGGRHGLTENGDDAAGAGRTARGEQHVRQQAGTPGANREVHVVADPVLDGRFDPVLAAEGGLPGVAQDRTTEVVVVLRQRIEARGKALRFIRPLAVVARCRTERTEVEHEVARRIAAPRHTGIRVITKPVGTG